LAGDIIDIGDPAEVAKKLPQFAILEMLGRGGMGVVYKARQRNLDRIVALKILPPVDALSPDFVARFTREARALAKLNHPNIVNVHDFGETGGLYYIIMEYVDGMNLRELLQTRRLAPAEALAIVPKICDALEYAHEEGLVHRDIKPENLLIDKKGRVKIADFGLAKLLRREPLDMTLTLSGMALGTLRYMAPEQMDKPESVDHRADLYSLGVVIYEMLTGEVPVGRFELPSQKAQVDVRLDEIVLHALEKEPARRYQHASEVRDDVEKVTSKPHVAPVPPTPPEATSLPKGKEKRINLQIPWGLILSVLVLGVVVAAVYLLTHVDLSVSGFEVVLMVMWLALVATIILVKRDWENRRLPMARKVLLTVLRLICSSCFVIFLNWSATIAADNYLSFTIGAPFPWFVFERAKSIGIITSHVVLWSWSWLILASGCFGHYALGKLKSAWLANNAWAEDVTSGWRLVIPLFKFTVESPSAPIPAAAANKAERKLPRNEIKPGAEEVASEPETAAVPPSAPLSPAEEAVRRARASWFGRRSERFRTLLPPALIFLELVFILGSFAVWPSQWFEWTRTYTPHKHGVSHATSSFAFHPFTLSFLLLLIGLACAFLARWFSRIDNLVRYGCLFRELRKDIQRQAKLKINGCAAVAIFAPILIAVLFEVITSGGLLRVAGDTYLEYQLWPSSKAYEQLLIDLPFYSISENGVEHYRRPNQWDMAIGLKTKDSAEPVTMDIEMPSLRASYLPSWSKDYEQSIVLDLAELTKWMSDPGKLDVKDEKVKKEAAELMALLKRFSRQAPVEFHEYSAAQQELMPDFSFAGSRNWPGKTSSFSSVNGDWIMVIYLGSVVIFLALYFVVAIPIQRAAFALDREVRERGESVLARGPLPRVKFGALPRDIRARTIRRAALAAAGLLLLPAIAALMESAQPKRVKETYYLGFVPQVVFEKADADNGAKGTAPWSSPLLKHFQEVIMTFAFESYERGGETWFVQPHPFHLELTFCRPKNFSDKPGEFHEVIPPGKGVAGGETFSFTVELPGLHANLDYITSFSSVTLDEEELLQWMQNTIGTTTVRPTSPTWNGYTRTIQKPGEKPVTLFITPMSETPELKPLAADLMAFLKNYATSAPTTYGAFMAAATHPPIKTPSLTFRGLNLGPREELTREGVAIIPAFTVAILIFLALLPLLKRSAVRGAMRQGTLDLAPQTPAPAGDAKPGEEKTATEPSLSRLALWGALWAPLFPVILVMSQQINEPSVPPHEVHYVGSFLFGPSWWQILLKLTLLPLGILTPFGTTILGAIAIAKIKRSNGKLYGLRLAAADALLFPLISSAFSPDARRGAQSQARPPGR
jgi:predicted Ser/Thr protein kinase